MTDVAIYNIYHEGAKVPEIPSPIIRLLHVGKGMANSKYLSDNTNDNISEKNALYAELTGQYWVWKNKKHDYVGFCHYRRYFIFDLPLSMKLKNPKTLLTGKEFYISDISSIINAKDIEEIISKYDVVLPKKEKIISPKFPYSKRTIESQYKGYYGERFSLLLQLMDELHEKDWIGREKVLKSKSQYFHNMFIMRYDLFIEYSKWLFEILATYKSIYKPPSTEKLFGWFGEVLLNMWLASKPGLNIKEVPIVRLNQR